MKILSNFDTKYEDSVMEKFRSMYWKENVLSIHRAQIFLVMYLLAPISTIIISWIIALIVMFYWDENGFDPIIQAIKFWLPFLSAILVTLYYLPGLVKKYIDYSMDFCVITPKEIVSYNQTWIMARKWHSIDTDKIKTITIDKKWFVKSLFNFWTITFLSEWDSTWKGDIQLNFVSDPDKVKNDIKTLIYEAYKFGHWEDTENEKKATEIKNKDNNPSEKVIK